MLGVRVIHKWVVRVRWLGFLPKVSSSCELTAMCMHLNSSLLRLTFAAIERAVLFCSLVGEVAGRGLRGRSRHQAPGGYPFPPHLPQAPGFNWVQQTPPCALYQPPEPAPLPSTSSSSSYYSIPPFSLVVNLPLVSLRLVVSLQIKQAWPLAASSTSLGEVYSLYAAVLRRLLQGGSASRRTLRSRSCSCSSQHRRETDK